MSPVIWLLSSNACPGKTELGRVGVVTTQVLNVSWTKPVEKEYFEGQVVINQQRQVVFVDRNALERKRRSFESFLTPYILSYVSSGHVRCSQINNGALLRGDGSHSGLRFLVYPESGMGVTWENPPRVQN